MERRENWLDYVGIGLSGLALLVALRDRIRPRRVVRPMAWAGFHPHPGPFRRPPGFVPPPPVMWRRARRPFAHRPHFHPWKGRRHGRPRWM